MHICGHSKYLRLCFLSPESGSLCSVLYHVFDSGAIHMTTIDKSCKGPYTSLYDRNSRGVFSTRGGETELACRLVHSKPASENNLKLTNVPLFPIAYCGMRAFQCQERQPRMSM